MQAHRENDPLQSRGRIQEAEECRLFSQAGGFKASQEFFSNLELVSLKKDRMFN